MSKVKTDKDNNLKKYPTIYELLFCIDTIQTKEYY